MASDEILEARLREHFAARDDGAPSAREIREMLPAREPRPRRLPGLAAAAAILFLIGLGVAALLSRTDHGFGDAPAAAGDEPSLRIAPSPLWAAAREHAEVRIAGGKATARLDYDPAGGGGRVVGLGPDRTLPAPVGREDLDGVATLLLPAADEPFGDVADLVWDYRGLYETELFLGGRTSDGGVGGLPLIVNRPAEMRRVGVATTPVDLAGGAPDPEAVVEVEVVRTAAGVRFRWGIYETDGRGWPTLDVVKWREEVSVAPGTRTPSPLLPGLAAHLMTARFGTRDGPCCVAYLNVGEDVSSESVLRVVECGGGNAEILWWPLATSHLPIPWSEDDAEALRIPEDYRGPRTIHIDAEGRRRERMPRPPSGTTVRIAAVRAAPWSVCRKVIEEARWEGAEVEIAFAPAAAKGMRVLPVPPPQGDDDAVIIDASPLTAGDVFPKILRLARRGARGFEFRGR